MNKSSPAGDCRLAGETGLSEQPTELRDVARQKCWVCGSARLRPWTTTRTVSRVSPADFAVTDSHFGRTLPLHRCSDCGFIFAAGQDTSTLQQLYASMSDPDYVATSASRSKQMEWLLQRFLRQSPDARSLLDVGAGIGLLVEHARNRGLWAEGVEPSTSFVSAAHSRGVRLFCGTLPHSELAGKTFDLITLVDLIEHVTAPLDLLRCCRELLASGGTIVVVTPDINSVAARVLGARWWHFRVAHVGYFGVNTLARLAGAAGLKVVAQERPLWFLPASYLSDRIATYLPWVSRLMNAAPFVGLQPRTVRLNLHDSLLLYLRQDK